VAATPRQETANLPQQFEFCAANLRLQCGTPIILPMTRGKGQTPVAILDVTVTESAVPRWEDFWIDPVGPDTLGSLLSEINEFHVWAGRQQSRGTWVWRGHSRGSWNITASGTTRAIGAQNRVLQTQGLIAAARAMNLDWQGNFRLSDMALLARLQHQGAATPLLDVTTDPHVALYMATGEGGQIEDNPEDGAIFAIRSPKAVVPKYDPRSIDQILASAAGKLQRYVAPAVDDRLRIQRGLFLLCPPEHDHLTDFLEVCERANTSIMRTTRLDDLSGDIVVFRLPWVIKRELKSWLQEQSGLADREMFPVAFDSAHLEEFSRTNGRINQD
jgi:FRG domain